MAIMEKAFDDVGLILCHLKHEHRRTLRTALVAEGLRSIKDVSEFEVIRDITEKLVPDLIVIDLDMPDGSTGEFVPDVRNGNSMHQSVYPDHCGYVGCQHGCC